MKTTRIRRKTVLYSQFTTSHGTNQITPQFENISVQMQLQNNNIYRNNNITR